MIETSLRLYPQRPFKGIEPFIETLNQPPQKALTDEEKKRVLEIEKKLTKSEDLNTDIKELLTDKKVQGIAKISSMKVNSSDFNLGYFETEEGKNDLNTTLNPPEPYSGTTKEEAKDFLYKFDYSDVKTKDLEKLTGNSLDFMEAKVLSEFESNGFIGIEGVENPENITVFRNPEVLAEKVVSLRRLKRYLKAYLVQLKDDESIDKLEKQALIAVIGMHKRRVNEMLAERFSEIKGVELQSKFDKSCKTTQAIEKIKAEGINPILFEGLTSVNSFRHFSRIDRYLNGAGNLITEGLLKGQFGPFTQEVIELSENVRNDSNPKFTGIVLDAKGFQDFAKLDLQGLGMLSSEDESSWTQDREGKPADGKWQAVIDPKRKSLSVNNKQNVLKIPKDFKRDISQVTPAGAVPVYVHERTHMIQHDNKRKLGGILSIMNSVGMDRSDVYKESGADYWETKAQEELFRNINPMRFHYLKAMQKKMEGGSYRECMKSFYDSVVTTEPEYKGDNKKQEAAKLAINRTGRLFRNGGSFSDNSSYLTNSSPLVYVEEQLLGRKIDTLGNNTILFVANANLEVLSDLYGFGLIDLSSIQVPDKILSDEAHIFLQKLLASEIS